MREAEQARFALVFDVLLDAHEDWLWKTPGRLEELVDRLRARVPGLAKQAAAPQEHKPTAADVWKIAALAQVHAELSLADLADLLRGLKRAESDRFSEQVSEITQRPFIEVSANDVRIALVKNPTTPTLLRQSRKVLEKRHVPDLPPLPPSTIPVTMRFEGLWRLESAWLAEAKAKQAEAQQPEEVSPSVRPAPRIELPGTTREPWVSFPDRDYFGLALSGGGIRSATFNLGVLQSLARNGVLESIDYLSTVSGGGYIGGFWTAWQHRKDQKVIFPAAKRGPDEDGREHPAIRHLREFSRFLMPRFGFSQSETWNGVVAVLAGAAVSALATFAAVGLVLTLWFEVTWALVAHPLPGALLFVLFTLVYNRASERQLERNGKLGDGYHAEFGARAAAGTSALTLVAWGLAFVQWDWFTDCLGARVPLTPCVQSLISITPPWWCLFAPAMVWSLTAAGLTLLRTVYVRFRADSPRYVGRSTSIDRAIGRCLSLSVVVVGLGLVWELAGRVHIDGLSGKVAGGSAVATTGAFVWLRDWLNAPVQETRGSKLLGQALGVLKPAIPKIAANLAAGLLFVLVAVAVRKFATNASSQVPTPGPTAVYCLLGFLLATVGSLLLFDPAHIGLHDFYRARIARCFLGASRAPAPDSGDTHGDRPKPGAATTEQAEDDLRLVELRNMNGIVRAIHLVCCAANNQRGDVLGTLYRGARSAVVSPFGVSVGNYAAPQDDLRLSAAVTASAAAVNSQMGSISMKLGPAVALLLSALNLRLGLWVPHPLNSSPKRNAAPGWYFFLEALGFVRSDQVSSSEFVSGGGWAAMFARWTSKLHLSDGGHFENLGLYELVRRHCRYVIVSDASADPDVVFDDLGNAIRRVREDFGVEVDLDVTPLRRSPDGLAKQHAVVGVIHYDGLEGIDKGMLLYLKPALTGDEPMDVVEHRARHPSFPHDGTGDQFYDEAQWESYRRLGEHSASVTLGVVKEDPASPRFVDKLFMAVNDRWHPGPADRDAVFLGLTERCAALESDMRDNGPATLRAEFFPEVEAVAGPPSVVLRHAEDEARVVYTLMLVGQLMEDVWLAADLDQNWSHPLNEGWMNYFHRWASTPSFRTWWPILRPIYSSGFRDFVKERFDIRLATETRDPHLRGGWLELRKTTWAESAQGHAAELWTRRYGPLLAGQPILVYELHLGGRDAKRSFPIQVGLLHYSSDTDSKHAEWKSFELFVPPALTGAGIVSRFLEAALTHFDERGYETLRVWLDDGITAGRHSIRARDPASRRALVQTISFYKSRGFHYIPTERGETGHLERVPSRASAAQTGT